jgi:deoxyribose-phosphate aldolase
MLSFTVSLFRTGTIGMDFRYEQIAKMIDHSLLKPTMDLDQLEAGCRLARAYEVASVCIMPYALPRCVEWLAGCSVLPSTTIGFPHGGHATAIKAAEARQAVDDGCQELDMVCNISQVLSGRWDDVRRDIQAVIEIAHAADRRVKVIFENCYLKTSHKRRLCEICVELKADWVKTSTGYGTGGATLEDLQLMIAETEAPVQVKAAGGIRDLDALLEVRKLGVSRVGASATKAMLDDCRQRLGLPAINVPDATPSDSY